MIHDSKRNLNIEILRIIAMLLVIVGHSIGHTSLLASIPTHSPNYYLVWLVQVVSFVATNIYVMISGYLLCKSTFKVKRVFSLWAQVFFHSVLFFLAALILDLATFSPSGLLKAAFCISGNQYWFARVYLGLYILMPFLNVFISKISQKQHIAALVVSVILFSLWRSFLPFAVTLNSEGGNSIIWFVVLYLFASYVRLYDLPEWLSSPRKNGIIAAALLFFSFLSSVGISFVSNRLGFSGKGASLFTEFTSFPMLFAAFFILIIAVRTRPVHCTEYIQKVILYFSTATFGVYLIHENIYVKRWLWGFLNIPQYASNAFIVLIVLAVAALLFLLCSFAEKLLFYFPGKLISRFNFDALQAKVDRFLNST